jgi:Aldehyde dehydrogenase family
MNYKLWLAKRAVEIGAHMAGERTRPPTLRTCADIPRNGIDLNETDDQAVELANNTQYGLAAYLHTRDLRRAHVLAAALDSGGVAVNGFPIVPPGAPFGGVKQSGFGREGGSWGLREFQRTKNVYIGLQ